MIMPVPIFPQMIWFEFPWRTKLSFRLNRSPPLDLVEPSSRIASDLLPFSLLVVCKTTMEGGTLSEIYQASKRLLIKSRDGLERLERLEFSSPNGMDSPELSFAIKRDITQIQTLCVEMDHLWRSIGSKPQRDLWKRKVEQVAEEVDSLRESLDKFTQRNQKRMMEVKERAELLQRANGDSSHVLRIFDEEAQAMQSARNSSLMIEDAYSTGVAILSTYAEQRDLLKSAQRKALDVLNTTTLSNSVLKLIERRHRVDKWIAYTGMAVTVIVVYAFWRWTH